MSKVYNESVLLGLRELFGSGQDADCEIVFCRDDNAPAEADGGFAGDFGPPLPALRMIVRLGRTASRLR